MVAGDDKTSLGNVGDWAELIEQTFVALDVQSQSDDFRGTVRVNSLGQMSVAEVVSVPQIFTRSELLVSTAPSDLFQVGLLRSGTAQVFQDGRRCDLSPGDFTLYESARPFRWELAGDWRLLVFTWDRSSIGFGELDSELLTARRMSGESGLSGVVSGALRKVGDLRGSVAPTHAIRFSDELGSMLLTAVDLAKEVEGGPDLREDLVDRILRHVESNIADPDLTPGSIAADFFMSTRSLHRLFASRGIGVASWIRMRRMDKCRRALLQEADTPITEIIARYGYVDLSHFSRSFAARYGVSPTTFRVEHG